MISNLERKLKFTMRPEASLVQVVEDYQATRPRKPGNIAFVLKTVVGSSRNGSLPVSPSDPYKA
jgi:hypothetical protein